MKTLLVSATHFEVQPLLEKYGQTYTATQQLYFLSEKLELLITGVGTPATIFHLTRILASQDYQQVVNVGVAGAFDRNVALGQVVQVTQDCFADIGAEDGDNLLTLSEMGLTDIYGILEPSISYPSLEKVKAITVNTTHGSEASIQMFEHKFKPQIESMEGAAFFYVCKQMKVSCAQIRAISNYVEKRDKSKWKMGEAIEALGGIMVL